MHHGGAGTTATGLIAGKPTLICLFLPISLSGGECIAQKGFRPSPLKQSSLSVERLASALRQLVDDVRFSENTHQLSIALRSENSAYNVTEWLEQQGIIEG